MLQVYRHYRLSTLTRPRQVIWCTSTRLQHQFPTTPLIVGSDAVVPVRSVRDLGIYLDSDLTMRTHIAKTISGCFAVLRQIRSIRRSITRPVLQSLVAALVLSKLDYGCAVLAGLPNEQLNRLQTVLNAAVRLIFSARKFDHVTPLLQELHWLRVSERVTFRLATLAYRCQHSTAPPYLAAQIQRVADMPTRHGRSGSTEQLYTPFTRRSTIGDRAFSIAASRAWNSLPPAVQTSESLPIFRRRLKTELFTRSFPAVRHWFQSCTVLQAWPMDFSAVFHTAKATLELLLQRRWRSSFFFFTLRLRVVFHDQNLYLKKCICKLINKLPVSYFDENLPVIAVDVGNMPARLGWESPKTSHIFYLLWLQPHTVHEKFTSGCGWYGNMPAKWSQNVQGLAHKSFWNVWHMCITATYMTIDSKAMSLNDNNWKD